MKDFHGFQSTNILVPVKLVLYEAPPEEQDKSDTGERSCGHKPPWTRLGTVSDRSPPVARWISSDSNAQLRAWSTAEKASAERAMTHSRIYATVLEPPNHVPSSFISSQQSLDFLSNLRYHQQSHAAFLTL